MDDMLLADRVRSLRLDGGSPKQIARELDMPRAKVTAILRDLDGQRVDAGDPTLVGCWVSRRWSVGLTVPDHPGWVDIVGESESGSEGLVGVLVAREDSNGGKVSACGYLVDVYCLGVKNTMPPQRMTRQQLAERRAHFFGSFEGEPLPIPLELARHLVFGAIDYADELGFSPDPDFPAAVGHLGNQWTGPSDITFGKDGKPFYISGPYDDPSEVMKTLQNSVGDGNFHFMTAVAPGM